MGCHGIVTDGGPLLSRPPWDCWHWEITPGESFAQKLKIKHRIDEIISSKIH
jgi:hypothetical protein